MGVVSAAGMVAVETGSTFNVTLPVDVRPTEAPAAPLCFELTVRKSGDGDIVPLEFTSKVQVAVTVPVKVTAPVAAKADADDNASIAIEAAIRITGDIPSIWTRRLRHSVVVAKLVHLLILVRL